MRRFMPVTTALIGALLLVGCGDPDRSTPERQAGPDSDPAVTADTTAPRLIEIMRQLEVDMERVAHGVWVENYDSVAVAGQAIADHPQVGPDERAEILGILGERGAGFRQADMRVHETAVELAEAARGGSMGVVLDALSSLQAECVACHAGYRTAIQEGRR